MIETTGLVRRFGAVTAVDQVTVSFRPGTVTGLLGLNGAGKTTLLRLIAGLEQPDGGSVLVCGKGIREQVDPMRILGMHFDTTALDPRHTPVRHLSWLAALGDVDSARVPQVLFEVGLAEQCGRRIAELSMGARQRLAIASALLAEPEVLIFDEPVNGLDVPGIVWLRELLLRLASDGRTVVVASHLLGEVVLTADQLVMMDRGRIAMAGPLAEVVPSGVDPRAHLESLLLTAAGA
jgi:ABC-2 type transport system ATP-binding protein